MRKRGHVFGVHLECLLNGSQDVFVIRESEEAFSDDQFCVHPCSRFAYFAPGVKSWFDSGSLTHIFRHPDGMYVVRASNQAVAYYHFFTIAYIV